MFGCLKSSEHGTNEAFLSADADKTSFFCATNSATDQQILQSKNQSSRSALRTSRLRFGCNKKKEQTHENDSFFKRCKGTGQAAVAGQRSVRVNKVARVLHAHRATESFGRRAAGKRVRRVEVCAFIDPHVQSINQFAAKPARENGNDDADPP
jgi:hypothetical protein